MIEKEKLNAYLIKLLNDRKYVDLEKYASYMNDKRRFAIHFSVDGFARAYDA